MYLACWLGWNTSINWPIAGPSRFATFIFLWPQVQAHQRAPVHVRHLRLQVGTLLLQYKPLVSHWGCLLYLYSLLILRLCCNSKRKCFLPQILKLWQAPPILQPPPNCWVQDFPPSTTTLHNLPDCYHDPLWCHDSRRPTLLSRVGFKNDSFFKSGWVLQKKRTDEYHHRREEPSPLPILRAEFRGFNKSPGS